MKTVINKPNAVQLMRDIRDQFSREIQDMSLAEQKDYMRNFLNKQKKKERSVKRNKDH